jgi:dUTPase
MSSIEIAITRLAHGEGLPLPDYASAGAAGLDLRAATGENETSGSSRSNGGRSEPGLQSRCLPVSRRK